MFSELQSPFLSAQTWTANTWWNLNLGDTELTLKSQINTFARHVYASHALIIVTSAEQVGTAESLESPESTTERKKPLILYNCWKRHKVLTLAELFAFFLSLLYFIKRRFIVKVLYLKCYNANPLSRLGQLVFYEPIWQLSPGWCFTHGAFKEAVPLYNTWRICHLQNSPGF